MSEGKKKEKYPALSSKEVQKEVERQEKAKTKYSMDQLEVEAALTEYLEQTDPMTWNGKAIAWIRRPSMKQLKKLIPTEMRKYLDNPRDVPDDVGKKYEKHFYEKMSEMIAIPEHTPEEWEAKANPWFIRLFWLHLANIANLMEGNIEGF